MPGCLAGGPHDGQADQVGEADLARRELLVQLRRRASRVATGTSRKLVAVGTASEAVMFCARRAAGPLMGVAPAGRDGWPRPRLRLPGAGSVAGAGDGASVGPAVARER